jgi:hypothetical protein
MMFLGERHYQSNFNHSTIRLGGDNKGMLWTKADVTFVTYNGVLSH